MESAEERPKSGFSTSKSKSVEDTKGHSQTSKGHSTADNKLIRNYKRQKSAIRWCLYLLLVLILLYAVIKPLEKNSTTLFRENGHLGSNIYFNDQLCLIAANYNGRQEVLMSTDTAKSFTRTGLSWPLRDSNLILGYRPASKTIIALEQGGLLRIFSNTNFRYDSLQVPLSRRDTAYGLALRPGGDLLYVYGKLTGLRSVNLSTLESDSINPFNDRRAIIESLVFDHHGKAAIIVYSYNEPQIFISDNLVDWKSPSDSSEKKSYSTQAPVTSKSLAYGDYSQMEMPLSVGFESHAGNLFYAYKIFRFSDTIYIRSLNGVRPLISIVPELMEDRAILDDQGNPIIYGSGSRLTSVNGSDSIPFASEILAPSPNRQLALIRNPTGNYLVEKKSGEWQINPVVITANRFGLLKQVLLYSILFLMVVITALLVSVFAIKRKILKAIEIEKNLNALFPKPEKPLGTEDEDLLGFKALEDAVHHIIRNPQLEMPMTIVVSGTWGSGKSSMMNRIKEELEQDPEVSNQFMTTWFNAWHLQGEASLLNAFLLNIIDSYERYYTFFSPFRLKIAVERFSRLPFWKKFGFGFSMAIFIPLSIAALISLLPDNWQPVIPFLDAYCATLKKIFMSLPLELTSAIINPVTAGILVIISFLFLNRQFVPTGLSAFFKLIPEDNFKLDVEKQETGTRDKFRRQYWEIMSAGRREKKLVIFIDDLDRISGDKILELLEGINFISDIASRPPGIASIPPNTIFILGMDTQEVARLVGTQLVKINGSQELPMTLGSRYIEKMVQLIVPVPFDTQNKDKFKLLYEN